MNKIKEDDKTQWLRSPLQERDLWLQPMRDLKLQPYFGARRTFRAFRTHLVLGSADDCDIVIDDPFVSPRHAELLVAEGIYLVRDLGSRNGVYLNGVRVGTAPLPSQGSLRLGRSTIAWSDPSLLATAEAEQLENDWVVADPAMKEVMQKLRRVAASSLPVLLLGETGTGKDVLARLVHLWGGSSSGPYVPVNGALTGGPLAESELFGHRKGAFTGAEDGRLGALRSAHGGTLFLDEVADIPACAQVKLLRALESGEVRALGSDAAENAKFRLVCASSRDLERKVRDGEFRLDLYYRVAGFVVQVPPLRDRPLDITAIARKLARSKGLELDQEAEARLLSARWPGNVRELRAAVERGVVAARAQGGARILPEHLDGVELLSGGLGSAAGAPAGRPLTLVEQERSLVRSALERNGWSRVAAARELGIARSSLHGKMRRFGLRDKASP